MWLCLKQSFISVVTDRNRPDRLLVRARMAGHIEALFPEATVFTDPSADYFFRAFIDREKVALQLSNELLEIDYDNFKASVADQELHAAYFEFWRVMNKLQNT
jgi:hypothetical protein